MIVEFTGESAKDLHELTVLCGSPDDCSTLQHALQVLFTLNEIYQQAGGCFGTLVVRDANFAEHTVHIRWRASESAPKQQEIAP